MGSRDTREVPKPHNTLSVNDRVAFCFSQTQVISSHNYFFSHLREGREKPHGALIMGFRPVLTVARLAPPVDLKDQARPPVEAQQPFSRRNIRTYQSSLFSPCSFFLRLPHLLSIPRPPSHRTSTDRSLGSTAVCVGALEI